MSDQRAFVRIQGAAITTVCSQTIVSRAPPQHGTYETQIRRYTFNTQVWDEWMLQMRTKNYSDCSKNIHILGLRH